MEKTFQTYIEWCKKYNLAPSHADNLFLYEYKDDMGFWFDELRPIIEDENNTALTENQKRALLNA